MWRVKVNCRWWCCGEDLLIASVISIWLVLLLGVFGLFCAVRVVSFDRDILSGFSCFWFGTLTGRRYQETASCQMLQVVPSKWVFVVVVVVSPRESEISDTLCLWCVGLRDITKGLIQKSASWFSKQCWPHGINMTRYVSIPSVGVVPCKHGQMLIQ